MKRIIIAIEDEKIKIDSEGLSEIEILGLCDHTKSLMFQRLNKKSRKITAPKEKK